MGRALIRWKPPLPKQEFCPDGKSVYCFADHEHESWLDLFLDLTIVALLINLSGAIYNCGNTTTVVFGCFRVVFIFFNTRLLVVDAVRFCESFRIETSFLCSAWILLHGIIYTYTSLRWISVIIVVCIIFIFIINITYSYPCLARLGLLKWCEIDTNYYDQFAMGYFVARGAVFFMY